MTTANKITLTRIAMIPFFLYFASQSMLLFDQDATAHSIVPTYQFPTATVVALVLFCVASFTDFLDGYVARKYNQVTDFGKFVDPLADKLLVSSALILFAEQGAIAGWMVCVILARELIITSLRVVAANKGRVLAATWTGKVKTCVQIGGIIVIYLYYILLPNMDFGNGPLWLMPPQYVQQLSGDISSITLVAIVGWVVTLVTIYSGWDYLRKNWDIIKDGAVKQK
nr:CDP-diacylglycerol--glycerol-3-phosphate 3-phosphatidyltransferase [uncultured Agathobaculum sp.]